MNKLRKSEVFSLLQPVGSRGLSLSPTDAAHKLFKDMRPCLERQSWDPKLSYTEDPTTSFTGSTFSCQETTVDDSSGSGFVGNITWLIDGPSDLTLANNPVVRDRVEETLHVNTLDWKRQAEVKFTRNVFSVATLNLSTGNTAESPLTDHRSLTMSFEADAPNDTDRLLVGFDASSGSFPNGYTSASTRVINDAPALSRKIGRDDKEAQAKYIASRSLERLNPGKDDIAALRVSVELLRKALAYLRQSPSA